VSITNFPVSSNWNVTISGTLARPQWLDEGLYPFQSRFVAIEGNRIHYIDEGTGPILFFLHPSIGWSFIYADIIKELRTRFRCIALDLPGYGLSPAVPGYQHTLTNDSRLVERFIQALGLTEISLFAHDITGSISLGASKRFLPEGSHVDLADVNGQPALIIRVGDRAYLVLTIEVEAQRIRTIRIIANPEKLAHI